VTTEACVDLGLRARATMVAKAHGVLAGLDLARLAFATVDETCRLEARVEDGTGVTPGTAVAQVEGPARALLTAERVALNFVQRLSGIATLTRRYVDAVEGTGAIILDTRKTTPGMRFLEKYAVRAGGGHNHRFGLFDMVLIKDNHIRAAGGLGAAVARVHAKGLDLLIEVEAQSLDEVREACGAGVDRILLDNMSVGDLASAIAIVDGTPAPAKPSPRRRKGARHWPEIEASGGITLATVGTVARLGVDYISVGALTHSAPALDLSLEIDGLG
jgi:nicotinate-nucleotide pyrophosphorylase (carboxylating)